MAILTGRENEKTSGCNKGQQQPQRGGSNGGGHRGVVRANAVHIAGGRPSAATMNVAEKLGAPDFSRSGTVANIVRNI